MHAYDGSPVGSGAVSVNLRDGEVRWSGCESWTASESDVCFASELEDDRVRDLEGVLALSYQDVVYQRGGDAVGVIPIGSSRMLQVPIRVGQLPDTMVLAVPSGSVIDIHIIDETGQPVHGAEVQLAQGWARGALLGYTDRAGRLVVHGLESGDVVSQRLDTAVLGLLEEHSDRLAVVLVGGVEVGAVRARPGEIVEGSILRLTATIPATPRCGASGFRVGA